MTDAEVIGIDGPTTTTPSLATATVPPRRPWQSRVFQKCALATVVYGFLSYLVFWPVSPFTDSRVVTCGCYDIAAQTWYMAWAPHALVNGLNPLFTHAMNVPYGVNLAANTAMPILGIAMAPVTWLFGPFASFDVLLRLAFFLSGLSMFFVLRRWVRSLLAAFVGGLLYGFSPYMFAQGSLHLNLAFVAVPPLIIYMLDEVLVRQRWSARRSGLVLGLLCALQYLITAEILADIVLISAIVIGLLIVRFPKRAKETSHRVLVTLCWAVLPFIILCGYPILFALHGPQHVDVNEGLIYGDSLFRADLFSIIVPTSHQLFGSAHWKSIADAWVGANANENDVYLGIPIVIGLLACLAFVRSSFVRVLGIVTAISFVLSLGPSLMVNGKATGIWMPFSLLIHVPVLQIEVPARHALLTDLCTAMILAVGLDRVGHWLNAQVLSHQRNGSSRPSETRKVVLSVLSATGVVLIGVGAVVTLWPKGAIASVKTSIPTYFTSNEVQQIPKGSTVLTYPYPIIRKNIAMSWQVESRFRFDIIGDYALTPFQVVAPAGGGPGGGLGPPTLDPPFVEEFFELANAGPEKLVPRPSKAAFWTTETFLQRYKITTILVDRVGQHPQDVTAFFTKMFKTPPKQYGTISAWYDVSQYHVTKYVAHPHDRRRHKTT